MQEIILINFNFKHTKEPVKLTMSSWQYLSRAKPTLKTILTPWQMKMADIYHVLHQITMLLRQNTCYQPLTS